MRRLTAVLLTSALLAANTALCAGWSVTAQARMACCSEDGNCPMEPSESASHGASGVDAQATADRCCAVSEHNASAASPTVFVLSSSPLFLTVSPVAAAAPLPAWHVAFKRSLDPAPLGTVPKHLLLSVLQV